MFNPYLALPVPQLARQSSSLPQQTKRLLSQKSDCSFS